jgi:hypothetical protein
MQRPHVEEKKSMSRAFREAEIKDEVVPVAPRQDLERTRYYTARTPDRASRQLF